MSNNKFKVLVVEDEANICSFIETLLETNGYQALVANTCAMGQTLFTSHNPDLIILDLGLPDRDGLELIRFVRQKFLTPIVVLSARTTEQDKIEALDLGANDYITKPFENKEMVARVKAVLRRAPSGEDGETADDTIRFPELTVSLSRYEVTYESKEVEMPPKELEVLYYLASHPNMVFTREQLLERVWGFDFFGDSRTVDVHIKRLREKLPECEKHGWEIHTVWRVGYKFEYKAG